ncbi:uncharacterized protein LOC116346079 [Contarinia nasturtii]|uniref:uncharacterized protein LOC116346079 n=1 Tax=Contarinia nasturtii TaxID=265458 RepID=UPI0012D3DF50|nr:uncharacterized protein LOC116346079 [Contarinia nasturtii]
MICTDFLISGGRKMPMANWQSKVNDINKILGQNAEPTEIRKKLSMDLRTVNSRRESNGTNWSSPTNLSERLMNVINYSDFKGASTNQTPHGNLDESNCSPIVTTTFYEQHGDTNQHLPRISSDPRSSNKCTFDWLGAGCSSSNVSIELNHNPEQVLNLMEMAKKNIVKLIDDQIQLIKYKPQAPKQCKQLKKLEMLQAIKTVERQDCIRRIREELTFKMDNLNKLLCELDEKS